MGKGHILVDLKRIEDIEKNGGGGGGVSTDTKDETVALSLENWILNESNNTYSQTVAVDGMTATSNPVVLLSGAADDPTDDEEESYACISSITTADDSITFVVDKMPKVSFNVIIKNVVNAEGGNDDVAELEGRIDALETEVDTLETEIGNKVDSTDSRLSDARTPLEHNHDDKYYTESEIDSKFNTTNQNVNNNTNAITQLNSDLTYHVGDTFTIYSNLIGITNGSGATLVMCINLDKHINGDITGADVNVEYDNWIRGCGNTYIYSEYVSNVTCVFINRNQVQLDFNLTKNLTPLELYAINCGLKLTFK